MSNKFQQQLESHTIHSALNNLESAIVKALEINQSDELAKIHKCHAWIAESLSRVDADLLSIAHLNTIQSHINNSLSQINNFISNKNTSHITQAVTHIDNAINLLPHISLAFLKEKSKENLNLAKTQLNSFAQELENKNKKLLDLEKNISTAKSTADDTKLTVDTTKKQNSEIISSLQKQFSEFQSKNLETFNKTIDEYKKQYFDDLSSLKKTHTNDLNVSFDKFENEMSQLLKDSEIKNNTITDLYKIVTGNSISGAYAKTSNEECETANRLRLFGIGCFSLGAMWVITCLIISVFEQKLQLGIHLSIEHMIPITTVTVIIISLGAYLVHQSEKHRKTSRWASQLHLELIAFDPFVYSLSKDMQEELRKSIAIKLFGQVKNPQDSYDKVSSGHLSEAIPSLLDKATELVKSIKTT